VLIYVERPAEDAAGATLTLTKARMIGLLGGDTSSPASTSSEMTVLQSLLGVLEGATRLSTS
jgi:hypothetical protein